MRGGRWRTDSTSARLSKDSFLEMTLLPAKSGAEGLILERRRREKCKVLKSDSKTSL